MDLTSRIVILHSSAKRAVELYRLFTSFGFDAASNWPVEELSKQIDATLPVSPQAALYDTATLVNQAKRLGSDICAADAVLIDAGSDLFWTGFAAALRLRDSYPIAPIVFVGPPGDSIGVQLLVNNASRRTFVAHVAEWSDVPTALTNLGIYPKTQVEETDVRNTDSDVAPEQPVVADRPEDPDRDPVHGGES